MLVMIIRLLSHTFIVLPVTQLHRVSNKVFSFNGRGGIVLDEIVKCSNLRKNFL